MIRAGSTLAHLDGMLTDPFGTSSLTQTIIGCAIRVHDCIGPGVFENVYAECMAYELRRADLAFERERPVPVSYRGQRLNSVYYIDFVVDQRVVLEIKSVAALAEVHRRQVLTQLRLAALPVGLLVNFNVPTLTQGGVKRIVNSRHSEGSGTGERNSE